MPMILLVHKEVYFNIDKHDHYILNVFVFLLQDYKDNFTNVIPNGLPPIREIKHQINLVPGATIPNQLAYRSKNQSGGADVKGIQIQKMISKIATILESQKLKFDKKCDTIII